MKTTLRAGANRHDVAQSGFARVDLLTHEDLYPNEGYQFPPGKTKSTNSYRVSGESPFNATVVYPVVPKSEEEKVLSNQMDQMIRTESLCTKTAATAISTGKDGEVYPMHSHVAKEAVLKERKQQIMLKEQLKIAKMKDDAHWSEVEQEEAKATTAFLNSNANKKRMQQQNLASIYKRELDLHKLKEKQAEDEEKAEADKLAELQRLDDEKEQEKLRLKRIEDQKRTEEYKILNEKLLNKKKNKVAEERAAQKLLEAEHAKIDEERAERAQRDIAIREAKNNRRQRLIDMQSMKLAEILEKNRKEESETQSAFQRHLELQEQARKDKQRLAREQMHNDWQLSLKLKQERLLAEKNRPRTPIEPDPAEDERNMAELVRKENMKRLRDAQLRQMAERRAREERERQEELNSTSQAYFLKDNEW